MTAFIQGLAIDFDKDPIAKRNKSYEADLQAKRFSEDDSSILRYYCTCCHTRCVVLDKVLHGRCVWSPCGMVLVVSTRGRA